MTQVSIVILNWNGEKLLQEFLPSVVENAEGAKIIVADNGSDDGSVSFLKNHFPSVECIALGANFGFCEGYNQAMKVVDTEFAVLLNSDVEVGKNWLQPLLNEIQKDEKVAAIQPKILSYRDKEFFEYAGAGGGWIDKFGYPFCRGRIFESLEKDTGQYNDIAEVFWATGACLMIRTKLFLDFGGLEPRFFAHMEEIDLCWRLQNAGYKILYNGKSTVYHLGAGTLKKLNPNKTYLNFRNGLALLYKNYPKESLVPVLLVRLVLDGIAGVQFALKGQVSHTLAIIKAHFHFYNQIGYWNSIRNKAPHKSTTSLNGFLNKSIVFEYFLRQRKTFSALSEKSTKK